MFLTEEEREVLKRVLERLLTPPGNIQAKAGLTLREQRELRRKAAEDGQKSENKD
jgi:DNA-binding CsgD family transcriptional regulator